MPNAEDLVYCGSCHIKRPYHSFIGRLGAVRKSCAVCRDRSKQRYEQNCEIRHQYYIEHKLERLAYARKNPDYVIAQKIRNYKRNDNVANRPFSEEEYITPLWVEEHLISCDNRCEICQKELKITGYEGCDTEQFTVDRIDDSLAHLKTNCQITCLLCNLSKPKSKKTKIIIVPRKIDSPKIHV